MAQRDQVARALGRHDGGDAGDAQHVALLGRARFDDGQGGRLHADHAGGQRHAMGLVLAADIDHVRLSALVEMGEAAVGRGVAGCAHAGSLIMK